MEMLLIPLGPSALVTLLLHTLGRPSKKPNQEGLVCCLALQPPNPPTSLHVHSLQPEWTELFMLIFKCVHHVSQVKCGVL